MAELIHIQGLLNATSNLSISFFVIFLTVLVSIAGCKKRQGRLNETLCAILATVICCRLHFVHHLAFWWLGANLRA